MHYATTTNPAHQSHQSRFRQQADDAELFAGLEEPVDRYRLLTLVKRAGKAAGFTARMIQLLDYYMAYTRDIDWEEGSRPTCFQSLAKTALAIGVSERQIQKIEQRLFEAGAIAWRDSGNHKRFGSRDEQTGRLRFAFGVDLSPLAYLREELEQKLAEKELLDAAWLETKRQISWYRGQIRGLIAELADRGVDSIGFQLRYDDIAVRIRTHLDLAKLRRLLDAHKRLHTELLQQAEEGTEQGASTDVEKFVHIETTNQPPSDKSDTGGPAGSGFQEEVVEGSQSQHAEQGASGDSSSAEPDDRDRHAAESAGLQHISLSMVLQAAGPGILERLPSWSGPVGWSSVVDATHHLSRELGVSQKSWSAACELLGRRGASVCLLVLDGAMRRRSIVQPAAYFNGMLLKARRGELRLHSSLYGLLGANEHRPANYQGGREVDG